MSLVPAANDAFHTAMKGTFTTMDVVEAAMRAGQSLETVLDSCEALLNGYTMAGVLRKHQVLPDTWVKLP